MRSGQEPASPPANRRRFRWKPAIGVAAALAVLYAAHRQHQNELLQEELRRLDVGSAAVLGEYEKVVITVEQDGAVLIDKQKPLPNLQDTLEILKHRHGSRPIAVTVEAAERSSTSRVQEVMAALKAAQITQVELTVDTDEM